MTSTSDPRRVLVVAYDFPPHGAIGTMRTLRVVQRLVEERWDVTVLTSDPGTFRPGTPVEAALLSRVPAGVRVVRARTIRGLDALKRSIRGGPHHQGRHPSTSAEGGASRVERQAPVAGGSRVRSVLRRAVDLVDAALAIPDNESGWLLPALARGLAATQSWRPDVIYSSAPPWTGQLVARGLAAMRRCPWVADFRDPWSRAPWRGNRFRFVTWSAARLERHVVNRADRILFVAQGNRDDFAAAYGADVAQRFHVVPNGCDPAEFQFPTPNSQLPSAEEGMFVLLHAGSLYAGRSPLPLLEALSTAIDRGIVNPATFRLRLLGQVGHASGDLSGTCRRLGLEHVVELVPRIPREQSLQAMCAASGLLLLQPGHTVSVPGKLYEYLATGRPILAVVEEGETADIVRRSGAGVAVAPDNEEAIVEALATFMRMASVGVAPPARELYDGTIRAAETVRILDAVARGDTQTLAANTAVNGSIQRCG